MNTDKDRYQDRKSVQLLAFYSCVLFLLFVSICFASLTIYFKDGSSKDVHKITFRGSVAELYLVDGNVITVPVERLDLPSSGIGAPVGTYGTSNVTGERTLSGKKGVLGSAVRQAKLRDEWEGTEKTASVVSSIGAMQRGDTVKIVGETNRNSRPRPEDCFDNLDLIYNPATNSYEFREKDLDHAFVIVYKNQDGTYGKRLFDAVTFNRHFKIAETPKSPTPMPEYPIIPDKKDPDVRETSPISPSQPKTKPETLETDTEEVTPGQEAVDVNQDSAAEPQEQVDMEKSSKRRSMIAYIIFVSVIAALGVGAWFVISRSQKPYIDSSKFSHYEDDLREFEIAIWLKNGKTAEQLMEICLKKFYQDSPAVVSICNKILKGGHRSLTVPFIAKQTGRSVSEAERIYDQIQNQIERIRNLIQEVSQKTGISPAKPAVDVSQKTVPAEIPRSSTPVKDKIPVPPPLPRSVPVAPQGESAPNIPGHSTSAVVMNPAPNEKPSSNRLIEPDNPMRNASDLPQYANSVLNQISFLSSKDDK